MMLGRAVTGHKVAEGTPSSSVRIERMLSVSMMVAVATSSLQMLERSMLPSLWLHEVPITWLFHCNSSRDTETTEILALRPPVQMSMLWAPVLELATRIIIGTVVLLLSHPATTMLHHVARQQQLNLKQLVSPVCLPALRQNLQKQAD